MDLNIYTMDGLWGHGKCSDVAIINIHRRGRIALNKFLSNTLNIQTGDQVLLAQDLDTRNDWYISFGKKIEGGYRVNQLRPKAPGKGLVSYYGRQVLATILNTVNAENSASFIVATKKPKTYEGRTWYRILTATPKLVR